MNLSSNYSVGSLTLGFKLPGTLFFGAVGPAGFCSLGIAERHSVGNLSVAFNLKAMGWAIPIGQSLDVGASIGGASIHPFGLCLIAGNKLISMMMDGMLGRCQQFKVFNRAVRMILVFVMNMMAFWHRAIVLLPKPNVIGFTFAILQAFALRGFQGFERIAGGLIALVMERAQALRMSRLGAFIDFANWSRGAALHPICADFGFERVASSLEPVVMKPAVQFAMSFSPAIIYRAWFSHGEEATKESRISQSGYDVQNRFLNINQPDLSVGASN